MKVVRLTNELDVKEIDIAKVLNLHPMMIYRWRQEYREGKFVEVPSRRIGITKDPKPLKVNTDKDDTSEALRFTWNPYLRRRSRQKSKCGVIAKIYPTPTRPQPSY